MQHRAAQIHRLVACKEQQTILLKMLAQHLLQGMNRQCVQCHKGFVQHP